MIILATLNARFIHTSLSLRYLYANLNELQSKAKILEFTINDNINDIAEQILDYNPSIVALSTYIWNASQMSELIDILKDISPSTQIILGGPEAGYLPHRVDFSRADYFINGEGEVAFYELCRDILDKKPSIPRFIKASMVDLESIKLPYEFYSDEDIAHRYIYVETSRGCPFECEFCLSSIDERVRYFPLDVMLNEFSKLWDRGVRNFKFIDRTFNLKISYATAIMDFFLSKDEQFFLHFEVIPDSFPDALRDKIEQFPAGSLQLEIGIQTLNPQIAKNINRPLRLEKIYENLSFLEQRTKAHMHLDLIVGLPDESIESFGANLDKLASITHSEIQIGILKKLSGTTLPRHEEPYAMIYSTTPPYDILQTNHLSYKDIQNMKRFARFWDIFYNSGNFKKSIQMLWSRNNDEIKPVFKSFYDFSIWIYRQTLSTYKISQDRQAELLYRYLCKFYSDDIIKQTLVEDLAKDIKKNLPPFLRYENIEIKKEATKKATPSRQSKWA